MEADAPQGHGRGIPSPVRRMELDARTGDRKTDASDDDRRSESKVALLHLKTFKARCMQQAGLTPIG